MLRLHRGQLWINVFPKLLFKIEHECHIDSCRRKSTCNEDQMSRPAELVHRAIERHKVVIFSKKNCQYCELAKAQFRKLKIPAYVVELHGRNDANEIQNVLAELTGRRTVPRCFINGKFIGGGTTVKQLYELGVLEKYFSSQKNTHL